MNTRGNEPSDAWRDTALRHYDMALQDASRRGFSLPIALLRAVEKLRETHFWPPHLVRVNLTGEAMLCLEEKENWPLPSVDWSEAQSPVNSKD